MRKILCCLIVFNCALAAADMLPSPDMLSQKKNQHEYDSLSCKDSKNLIVCHYSVGSSDIEDCHVYAEKPKEFKKLGRSGGASFGEEKYCSIKGKDKS